MEKYLPIKFFEKRKIDELLTEGGGNSEPPKWVLQGDELVAHSQQLSNGLSKVNTKFQEYKAESHTLPMVMATTIAEPAIAKSHRGDVVDLLNCDKKENVIGIDSNEIHNSTITSSEDGKAEVPEVRRILSIVTTDELIANIYKALRDTNTSAKLISSIEDLRPFTPNCEKYNPHNTAYRVMLIDYNDTHRNEVAQQLFVNNCKSNGIPIKKITRYSRDMSLYRIEVNSEDDMHTVASFDGISSIEETKPILTELDDFGKSDLPSVKRPDPQKTYPVVGVLDTGIARNDYLAPWILKDNDAYYEEPFQNKDHGTKVASVLEYSDELNGTHYTATDGVMMLEAIIAPDLHKESAYPEDIIDNVRDAIERHPEIKIWTMSVGTMETCDLSSFSPFGIALDNIADENNVLIIKSAGNYEYSILGRPYARIAKMADSVRSIVVGSIAHAKGKYDLVDINMPSPFTRIGPGPAYIIKPDVVAYGGNAGLLPDGNITSTGVNVLDEAGEKTSAAGTSFSTPWVARIASELNYLLEGDFDPLLIKALMVQNSRYPAGNQMSMQDKKDYMGFGMPASTRDILYNSENEITLILRDSLQKGTFIDILDFPFAQSLVGDDGYYHGQIILTVVSAPTLRSSEGSEYCQSDISVAFGTMDGIRERDTNVRTIRNPYGANDPKNIMLDSLYSRRFFNVLEDDSFGKERTLISYGSKYHPIKKYAIDLDEMTHANQEKYLKGNRQWYMELKALFRNALEREAREADQKPQVDFCLLLTVRDPSGKAPVYNEVTQQLQEKNFVYSNMQLRTNVNTQVHIDEK